VLVIAVALFAGGGVEDEFAEALAAKEEEGVAMSCSE